MDFLLYAALPPGGRQGIALALGVRRWRDELGRRVGARGSSGRRSSGSSRGGAPPESWARTTTNLVHWATGIGWGIQYGALARRQPGTAGLAARARARRRGCRSYAILPLAKVYKPIWEYDARTLGDDLSAHLVFGAATAAAFAVLNWEGS